MTKASRCPKCAEAAKRADMFCARCGASLLPAKPLIARSAMKQLDLVARGAFRDSPMAVIIPAVGLFALALANMQGVTLERTVLTVAALAPGLYLLEVALRTDRFPEPTRSVLLAFAVGALSCLPAGLAEKVIHESFGGAIQNAFGWFGTTLSRAFLQAAFCEETVKYLILMLICVPRKAFDEPMDGVVYGVAVSLGFATLENLLYVVAEPTLVAGLVTAFWRAVTAVPGHGAFGAVMGFCVGLAMYVTRGRPVLLLAGWVLPIAMHGAYDLLLFANGYASGALSRLWYVVFTHEVSVALRMIRKLQAVQGGRTADSLAQAFLRRARRFGAS